MKGVGRGGRVKRRRGGGEEPGKKGTRARKQRRGRKGQVQKKIKREL